MKKKSIFFKRLASPRRKLPKRNSRNSDLLAHGGGPPARRRRRKIPRRYRVEMAKPLAEEESHRRELVDGDRGADVRQQVSRIVNPGLGEGVHPGTIHGRPHDSGRDGEDPRDDRRTPLLAGMAELPDVLVVILQGVPDRHEAASPEHRQAQLVHHDAVVDDHLRTIALSQSRWDEPARTFGALGELLTSIRLRASLIRSEGRIATNRDRDRTL